MACKSKCPADNCRRNACSTLKPDIVADLFVVVPVTKAAVTSTTYMPWIELIGERASIDHYTGTDTDISSTCLKKLFDGTHARDRTIACVLRAFDLPITGLFI